MKFNPEVEVRIRSCDLPLFRDGSHDDLLAKVAELFGELEHEQVVELFAGFCHEVGESFDNYAEIEEESSKFTSETSGQFTVTFTGTAHNGCKGMTREYSYFETVDFNISLGKSSVLFSTNPSPPADRYPNDEL